MPNLKKLSRQRCRCHDCGARPGEYHQLGCDVERCPRCGGQFLECLACGCEKSEPGEPWPPPLDDRQVWTGEWPGVQECREFGWYAKPKPDGTGYIPCEPGDPGAAPDLNRLFSMAEWDRQEKRYVFKNRAKEHQNGETHGT